MRIGAIRNVLDEAGRQTEQRDVVVNGEIEPTIGHQKAARKHEIADAAVCKTEGIRRCGDLLREARETGCNGGSQRLRERGSQQRGALQSRIGGVTASNCCGQPGCHPTIVQGVVEAHVEQVCQGRWSSLEQA
jgi:hypothetical protein